MPFQRFDYVEGELHCEDVALSEIAEAVGTPSYVYSVGAIRENLREYQRSLSGIPHEIHYAVKANSCLAVLAVLAKEGAGFDIVSEGELYRVRRAGGEPSKTVFSGAGKTAAELRYALKHGIGAIHCESVQELELLQSIAMQSRATPRVALRVNPNIDADTHPYIATGLREHKFGIALHDARAVYLDWARWEPLRFTGVSCHIGSQIFDIGVFEEALRQVLALAEHLRDAGLRIRTIDLGGGLAVGYRADQASASISAYGAMLSGALSGTGFRLSLEPGRSIVGQAGVLLTRALYRKPAGRKTFVVVDGAMNDLIRPALYEAHHEILPTVRRQGPAGRCDIVGPVCESGDFLGKDRDIGPCRQGDLLAVGTAGAYGFVQSSNYNSRRRAAEVLVDRGLFRIVRERESLQDLVRGESVWTGSGTVR